MCAYNICLVFTLYLHVLIVIEERNHFGFLVIHYAVHLAYLLSAPLWVYTLLELEVNSRFLFFTAKSVSTCLGNSFKKYMWNNRRITAIETSLSILKSSYVIEQLVI